MLPNIDLRIANMIKALEQVVLPALPSDQRLARDQARLVIGHLAMVRDQWKLAARFEARNLDGLLQLAEELEKTVQAGPLRAAAKAANAADRRDVDAVEDACTAIGRAIDEIIIGDGATPLPQAAIDAILKHGEGQAWRERIWFRGHGLDPDMGTLPAIAAAID